MNEAWFLSFGILQAHTGGNTAEDRTVQARCLKGCTDNVCSAGIGRLYPACRQGHRGGGTEVGRRGLLKKYKLEGREGYSRQRNSIEKIQRQENK